MGNDAMTTEEFWGYLIKEDKSPAPVFEQLLLGIANYINRQIAPWDTQCLTPAKLAAFYRLVGGNYNVLFLETPQPSLSFIYQSLGCYHTLQPDQNPYAPPSIPALTPQGFVRWQTVQLLLEPEEHVPLLQTAVKRFDITNPADGIPFPNWLPREALPSKPDPEMLQWHDTVADSLMKEVMKSQAPRLPSMHTRALSDVTSDGTLESSRDSHSRGSSTTDDQSLINVATYTSLPPVRPAFRPPKPLRVPSNSRPHTSWGTSRQPLPWNPERRRSNSDPQLNRPRSSGWSHKDGIERRNTVMQNGQHLQPRPRPRSPSTVSTSSTSSSTSSSSSSSDESDDLYRHRTSSTATLQPPRRHSSHHLSDLQQPPRQSPPPFPSRPYTQQDPASTLPPLRPSATLPSKANARGLNVRWGADSVHDIPPGRDRDRSWEGNSRAKSEERPRRHVHEERERRPVTGVGGRRYPANGTGGCY